jgi:hypothetical protein
MRRHPALMLYQFSYHVWCFCLQRVHSFLPPPSTSHRHSLVISARAHHDELAVRPQLSPRPPSLA